MLTNKTHLHYFGTTPMLTISNTPLNYLELRFKDLFDFLFSVFVVVVFSPLFVILALAIKIDSKGPVYFAQKRVGLRGRKFHVFKFRTMVTNAEELKTKLMQQNEMDGPVFKMTNDPRITRVGRFLRKTSLDELPQFFNVLTGDMSVVGPRPPIPEEVKQYESWQLRRLSMKPGITCIWQVSGRNNIPFDEWMKMDLQYIDNWSLKLDFVIFLKTIRTMVRGDGK
jgi:exopolysaccharide biosynthesis polyprenyl glycosylphosphotransferase